MSSEKLLRVVVKRVNKAPVVEYVLDHFREMGKLVGGYFEVIFWDETSCLYVNENGLINNLPGNIIAPEKLVPLTVDGTLRGDIFAMGHLPRSGNARSLTDKQVEFFTELFENHKLRSLEGKA